MDLITDFGIALDTTIAYFDVPGAQAHEEK